MKRQSNKQRAAANRLQKFADAYREYVGGECSWCNRVGHIEPHHINAGSDKVTDCHPDELVFLCRECHEDWQATSRGTQFMQRVQSILQRLLDGSGRKDFR